MRRLWPVLFPDPPRRFRGRRAVSVALRTAHLMTFGALVGGHVFDVEPARLVPFLVATIASGAGLVAIELTSSCEWIFMGKGLAVMAKLLLLLSVPLFWEHRLVILLGVVAIAGVAAHMPSGLRHYSLLPGASAAAAASRPR